ncbi:MAG: molybdopterin-dependent oxidoreductase, partial [Nitrososphaerales archaeon]
MEVTRRDFLKIAGATGVGLAAIGSGTSSGLELFEPTKSTKVQNPNESYPDRNWEEVYRNIYRFDREFRFNCTPNDTHNCRLTAYVRNGIVTRVEQSYDHQKYRDIYGNVATAAWNPRGCLKGYSVTRRVYGPYRIRYPQVRKGWLEWVNAGFPDPRLPENQQKYFQRGKDPWVRVSSDEIAELIARTLLHVAKRYSGEEGARLLKEEGYPEEMIESMKGNWQSPWSSNPKNKSIAGVQTFKFRPGMPMLGGSAKLGNIRNCNQVALLDHYVRGVPPDECRGARYWSNYTWHGDLDPGTPMVTGLQTFDPEFADHRSSKMYVLVGKNFIENKMPEAHWMNEIMERGGKIVIVSPEYSPSSSKADYWMSIRPGADVALFLGVCNIIIQEKLYDEPFVKRFTDFPLLVRGDTLKLLLASDIIKGYKNKKLENLGPQIIKPEMREEWGDRVVWDKVTNKPATVTRDDVGVWFDKLGVDPALDGTFNVKLVDGKEIEVKTIFQLYKEQCAYYDLDKVHDITGTPKELIPRFARDFGTIKPVQIHTGEGTNH